MTTLVGGVLLACLVLLSVFYLVMVLIERQDGDKMPGWVMHLLAVWGMLSAVAVLAVPVVFLFALLATTGYFFPSALVFSRLPDLLVLALLTAVAELVVYDMVLEKIVKGIFYQLGVPLILAIAVQALATAVLVSVISSWNTLDIHLSFSAALTIGFVNAVFLHLLERLVDKTERRLSERSGR